MRVSSSKNSRSHCLPDAYIQCDSIPSLSEALAGPLSPPATTTGPGCPVGNVQSPEGRTFAPLFPKSAGLVRTRTEGQGAIYGWCETAQGLAAFGPTPSLHSVHAPLWFSLPSCSTGTSSATHSNLSTAHTRIHQPRAKAHTKLELAL